MISLALVLLLFSTAIIKENTGLITRFLLLITSLGYGLIAIGTGNFNRITKLVTCLTWMSLSGDRAHRSSIRFVSLNLVLLWLVAVNIRKVKERLARVVIGKEVLAILLVGHSSSTLLLLMLMLLRTLRCVSQPVGLLHLLLYSISPLLPIE